MKKTIIRLLLMGLCTANAYAGALDDMASRLFGDRAREFVFTETDGPAEYYKISADNGKVKVEGSTPSAMAVGLNRYLREMCKTDVSWYLRDSVMLPPVLPMPVDTLEGEAMAAKRFFLNYCTYGYSMAFWDWNQWERLIDWMALQGVNAPLAIAGQEAVWQRVWESFGLDKDSIRSYFSGPAHLPWHRMLNLDRWDGPLPQSYIDSQEVLQKQIVRRARELGMKPVLPAFAGHVPPELSEVCPGVKIHPMSAWGSLDSTKYRSYFIDPSEAVFDTIQHRFLTEQARTYGSDHIYGLDPFNEIDVPSWEPDYLRNASRRIYESLANTDPDAYWLQMAWMFHCMSQSWTPERVEAFLSGVSPDRMILLDYYCEFNPLWPRTEAFHGRDFIWCYLGNFGGNSFLAGDMDVVNERVDEVLQARLPNFAGIGGTLEALDVNRHMHSFALDKAWNHKGGAATPGEWIDVWASMRGAADDPAITEAWQMLYRDIYHSTSTSQACLINARPTLEGFASWTTDNTIKYDNAMLWEIWLKLINAESDKPAHRYDVVNIGRQVLGNHFATLRDNFTAAYRRKDIDEMRRCADLMDAYIIDYDSLLAADPAFSLGKWLADARRNGINQQEADYYETNARHLITTWCQPAGFLNDYANRDLAGLASSFYLHRWRTFTDAVINAVTEGREWVDLKDPYYAQLAEWEWNWCDGHESYEIEPRGDAKAIARALFAKYSPINPAGQPD